MSEYLTPEEVEQTLKAMGESWFSKAEVATLRAYAKVVEAVAKKAEPGMWGIYRYRRYCPICEAKWDPSEPEKHREGCVGPLARKLRSHAE